MSSPPLSESPPRNKLRKKRSADVVSFEDLLAAHKTERGPGQLPAEGVVLIGVDFELQRRMAERVGQAVQEQSDRDAASSSAAAAAQLDSLQSVENFGAPKNA